MHATLVFVFFNRYNRDTVRKETKLYFNGNDLDENDMTTEEILQLIED
jgi:hypothetical protein